MEINKKIKNFCSTDCDDLENDYSGSGKMTKAFPFVAGIIIGLLLIIISLFFFKEKAAIGVAAGVGIISSLITAFLIIRRINAIQNEQKKIRRQYYIKEIVEAVVDTYQAVNNNLEHFVSTTGLIENQFDDLYENPDQYSELDKKLREINYAEADEVTKTELNLLFNFKEYHVQDLAAELKRFYKKEYFYREVLTKDELEWLCFGEGIKNFINAVGKIEKFRGDEIKNYRKCVVFLKATVNLCCEFINQFDYCKEVLFKNTPSIFDSIKW